MVVADKELNRPDPVRASERDDFDVRRAVQGEMVTQSFEGLRRRLESVHLTLGHVLACEPEREQTDVGAHVADDRIRGDQRMVVPI